jgi:ssDNA-binding replication factor A large subunit
MSFDEMVERILSSRLGVSRESVLQRLERERSRAGGLISDEALLRMIAAGLGCEMGGEAAEHVLLLKDLIPGLGDISVVGRVVAVFSPRAFGGSRKGRFASLFIADESSIVRLVLWNDKAGLTEHGGVKAGEIVRFRHGYTREGFGGKVEVNIGESCTVEVNPSDVNPKSYPSIGKFTMKIGELSSVQKSKKVNVAGTVKRLGPVSEFERSDSSVGKVMRFVLSDGSGEVAVVVWNEKVDEIQGLVKAGGGLQVVNGKVKKAAGGALEVHVDSATYVGVQASSEFSSLASLKEGLGQVSVAGEVATRPMVREVKTSRQEVVRLATFELRDDTGRVWVSAWRDHADSVKDLNVGDRIVIKNGYVKKGFGDQIELSTRSATSIAKET